LGWSSNPFPTYHRFSIRPSNVLRLAVLNGFSVLYKIFYRIDSFSPAITIRNRMVAGLTKSFSILFNALSLFKYDFSQSECIMIFKKN
jgi:hypothetical protein